MKRTRTVLVVLAGLYGLAGCGLAAQAQLLPSSLGVDVGIGPNFPRALEPPCPDGRPLAFGGRLSWVAHRLIRVQATASRFANGAKASCGDIVPCPREQPCPREKGIGQDLMPIGVRFLLEPMGQEARWSPRLGFGAGRLVGDGESYAVISAGVRYVVRHRLNVTLEMERLLFRASVDVLDRWTNEPLSRSRDAVAVNLLRVGIEWDW